MDSFLKIFVNARLTQQSCCSIAGTTTTNSTISINQHNNTSATEQQSSSGEDSTVNRKGVNNFKSINFEEKSSIMDNIDKLDDNEAIKVKSSNENINVSENKDLENNNEGIYIEKNELFTFMTIDNNNNSQRVTFILCLV